MPILRRQTKQRRIILRELRKVREHPTARKIYKIVKRYIPSISFATVYRNLGILRDSGRILELDCGSHCSRYDGFTDKHHHFICESCQNVLDLAKPVFSDLDNKMARKLGCKVNYHRINFYGLCKTCKEKITKKRRMK